MLSLLNPRFLPHSFKRVSCLLLSVLFTTTFITSSVTFANTSSRKNFCAQNFAVWSGCGEECSASTTPPVTSAPVTSTANGGGCGGTTEENKAQIWNFLRGQGLTEEAAAGIMGNMEQESTFNPKAVNPIGCTGIVQWCGSRYSSGNNDTANSLLGFAKINGNKDPMCLGTQLEYMWQEMTVGDQGRIDEDGNRLEITLPEALNGQNFSMKSDYSGSGAAQAANIFQDFFERANKSSGEHLGRAERADKIYQEFTGKAPEAVNGSSGSAASSDPCKTAKSAAPGTSAPIPAPECATLNTKLEELIAKGTVKPVSPERIENDLKRCTNDQITCGTTSGGGINPDGGGVNPTIVRAFVAAVENSGPGSTEIWSFNSGHSCDGLNHPNGKAVDIPCNGNNMNSGSGASEKCNALFKYFYDNYEALGLSELIWQYPPTGYSCSDPKILCNIGGHADHIHVGVRT